MTPESEDTRLPQGNEDVNRRVPQEYLQRNHRSRRSSRMSEKSLTDFLPCSTCLQDKLESGHGPESEDAHLPKGGENVDIIPQECLQRNHQSISFYVLHRSSGQSSNGQDSTRIISHRVVKMLTSQICSGQFLGNVEREINRYLPRPCSTDLQDKIPKMDMTHRRRSSP